MSNMYKYNIYIGMFDKDTKQQEISTQDYLNKIRQVLRLNRIGNYTIYKGKGHYMSELQVVTKPTVIVEIVGYMYYNIEFINTLKHQLKTELNQEDILITRTEVEVL